MEPLASISRGKAYWPKSSERMDEAFEQIALDLRRQYSLGYLPANFAADGKRHKIKVVLTAPREQAREMVVRHREGYYAIAKVHGSARLRRSSSIIHTLAPANGQ